MGIVRENVKKCEQFDSCGGPQKGRLESIFDFSVGLAFLSITQIRSLIF
jgi:hypothetical protein